MGRTTILVALCALLGSAGGCVQPPDGGAGTETPRHFLLGVEQDGRKLPIGDHQVTLTRRPFTVLVAFPVPDAVLVNASFGPECFDAARSRVSFANLPAFAGSMIREELFNRDKVLVVGEDVYHNWKYFSEKIHSFDSVASQEGAWICRRTVAKCQQANESPTDIANLDKPAVYLVFINTKWNDNHTQRIERQRDYLKLVFE